MGAFVHGAHGKDKQCSLVVKEVGEKFVGILSCLHQMLLKKLFCKTDGYN